MKNLLISYLLFTSLLLSGKLINAQGTVHVFATPQTQTMKVGDTSTIVIQVEAGTQAVSGVQLIMSFDPTFVKISSSNPIAGELLPQRFLNTFDNTTGTIKFAAGAALGTTISGTFDALTFEIEALTSSASTEFVYDTTSLIKTKISSGVHQDLLGTADPIQVTINNTTSSEDTITGFTLIDADKNQAILDLQNEEEYGISLIKYPLLNIRVNTTENSPYKSYVLTMLGQDQNYYKSESVAPYALFGDFAGNYNGKTLTTGMYTLKATPYTELYGAGTAGKAKEIIFYIKEPAPTKPIAGFTLIDASKNEAILDLVNEKQHTIEFTKYPSLNIRVNTTENNNFKSYRIAMQGQGIDTNRIENVAPYALFGDFAGNYNGKRLKAGSYVIKATPYSELNGAGIAGEAKEIIFYINDSALTANKRTPEDTTSFQVIPNPIQNKKLTISLEKEGSDNHLPYSIYNSMGQLIDQGTSTVLKKEIRVDLSSKLNQRGVYNVLLSATSGSRTLKFVY